MKPSLRWFSVTTLLVAASVSTAMAAATATTSFNVTATVIDVCAVSATNLGFGTYSPIGGSALDGSSTITVTCTLGTPYNVRLDAGANGASVSARQMLRTSGTETLPYYLYRNAGRTQNWGLTDNTDTVSATGTGVSVGHTVYGRIPASSNVPAGSYTDTVNVTVSY